MQSSCRSLAISSLLALALAGCATGMGTPGAPQPLSLDLTRSADREVTANYRLRQGTTALHFPQELGGYRAEAWKPIDGAFRWVKEGDGERIERTDGRPFRQVAFRIAIDYRALPKSYAPFSPFSEGGALVYSGQFHACPTAPCEQPGPLPIRIDAPGEIVGVEGRRSADRDQFVSRDEGTSIFIGTLKPVDADGFVAIIDPGLPTAARQHLDRSLPEAIQDLAAIYGPLSFKPELYVSIDDEPEKNGRISSQGGTLPRQIFMHFDGEGAKQRVLADSPLWLEWFFAHEAAHLFQQDKSGKLVGDDRFGWMHEGGADAMAALAMVRRGPAERAYVVNRKEEAEKACAAGLATTTLSKASAEGKFDLHYQCGLIMWLAIDQDLRRAGKPGLADLNRAMFAAVRSGQEWGQPLFSKLAGELGASPAVLMQIMTLADGNSSDALKALGSLGQVANESLKMN
jgi:hypothetical protein